MTSASVGWAKAAPEFRLVHLFGVRLCPRGRARQSGRGPIAWARRSRRRAIVGTPRPPCPPYTNRNRPQYLLRVKVRTTGGAAALPVNLQQRKWLPTGRPGRPIPVVDIPSSVLIRRSPILVR